MFLDAAKEIWEGVCDTCSMKNNAFESLKCIKIYLVFGKAIRVWNTNIVTSVSPTYFSFATKLSFVCLSKFYRDAMLDSRWKNTINEEMIALRVNETWELIS